MTGLIRSGRIGGRRTEPRRCAPGRAMAVALAATVAGLHWRRGFPGIDRRRLRADPGDRGAGYARRSVHRRRRRSFAMARKQRLGEAARKAQAPGGCPSGQIQDLRAARATDCSRRRWLCAARRRLAFLDRQGIEVQPVLCRREHRESKAMSRSTTTRAGREPPKLDTSWMPPKGSKVKPGDQIKVKMVARDDANHWQTGIKPIDLR